MLPTFLIVSVFFLAWANGANDNFKGVATLYGSGTTTFRRALVWATGATVAGSLVSVAFASRLVAAFQGKGLVPNELLGPRLLTAVAASGAITILLATILGMPTSTTHALTGALVGAGLAAAGSAGIGWNILLAKFAQPLLLSPLLSIGSTAVLYLILHRLRKRLEVDEETCLCVGRSAMVTTANGAMAMVTRPTIQFEMGHSAACVAQHPTGLVGVRARKAVDVTHYLSAGAVCFARAVNDTPKIAALLLGAAAFGTSLATPVLAAVALAMAAGGWFHSRKVAETMSKQITELNDGQGLTANVVTAFLVLAASRMGVPVSTTHVSCGAIFGIGLVNGRRDWGTIRRILATWLTTLPLGLLLGLAFYAALG